MTSASDATANLSWIGAPPTVVYNSTYGGFHLSHEAFVALGQKMGADLATVEEMDWHYDHALRSHWALCTTVKELGAAAGSAYAKLKLLELPVEWDGCYTIAEYDGWESVRWDKAAWLRMRLEQWIQKRPDLQPEIQEMLERTK